MWNTIKYDIPEMLDNWRVIPRLLIFMYAVVFYQTMNWFMLLDNPNNAQAGFVSVIVGAGAAWFGLYVNSTSTKHDEISVAVPQQTGSIETTRPVEDLAVIDEPVMRPIEEVDDLPPPRRNLG